MRISDWSSDVCSSDLSMVWPFDNARAAAGLPVKLTAGGPGSAETLTLAVFKAYPDLLAGLDIDCVGGDPAQVQNLLLSRPVHRPDERRGGKAGVRQCRSWWPPEYSKNKTQKTK